MIRLYRISDLKKATKKAHKELDQHLGYVGSTTIHVDYTTTPVLFQQTENSRVFVSIYRDKKYVPQYKLYRAVKKLADTYLVMNRVVPPTTNANIIHWDNI